MTVTINGTSGVTAPEVTLDNSAADGGQVVLKSSGYSNWNIDNYNGSLRSYYGSTVATSIDASSNFQMNSGYGSVATAYGCRAWVNFNGTGTVAIRGSGNVSSITDNGSGDYTVNLTTAMPDANYSVTGTCYALSTGDSGIVVYQAGNNTNSARIYTAVPGTWGSTSLAKEDPSVAGVAIFR